MTTSDKSKPVRLDELAMKLGGRYRLAITLVKRARDIVQASSLHPERRKEDPVRRAMTDVSDGRVQLVEPSEILGLEETKK